MRILFVGISLIALGATLAPSVLFYTSAIDLNQVKTYTLVGTLAWFLIVPLGAGLKAVMAAERQE